MIDFIYQLLSLYLSLYMKRLVQELKYLFKATKSLGVSLGSLQVILSLAFGHRIRAVDITKAELRRNPCNWSWCLFLLEHYRSYSDRQSSVELLERFSSSCLSSLFCEQLPFSNEPKQISFNSIVEAFFLSSCDKRDFCEFDFLGGSHTPSFSLHIVFVGRFSNFLVQLANAIAIAKAIALIRKICAGLRAWTAVRSWIFIVPPASGALCVA
jgi:hypothetical protein